jgi:hypothetical protein
MKMTFQQMVQGLNDLSAEELLALNKQLNVVYKTKRSQVAVQSVVTGKFQVGDVIKFYKSGRGRSAGWNYFKFEHLNRAGDCMQGPTCDENGKVMEFGAKWTVGLTQPTLEVAFRNGKPV